MLFKMFTTPCGIESNTKRSRVLTLRVYFEYNVTKLKSLCTARFGYFVVHFFFYFVNLQTTCVIILCTRLRSMDL